MNIQRTNWLGSLCITYLSSMSPVSVSWDGLSSVMWLSCWVCWLAESWFIAEAHEQPMVPECHLLLNRGKNRGRLSGWCHFNTCPPPLCVLLETEAKVSYMLGYQCATTHIKMSSNNFWIGDPSFHFASGPSNFQQRSLNGECWLLTRQKLEYLGMWVSGHNC